MTDFIGNPPLRQDINSPRSKWPEWFTQVYTICFSVQHNGTTAQRPTTGLWIGRPYFDTTLGYKIWYDGTNWVDATGSTV